VKSMKDLKHFSRRGLHAVHGLHGSILHKFSLRVFAPLREFLLAFLSKPSVFYVVRPP
jgi:hypothetical protein